MHSGGCDFDRSPVLPSNLDLAPMFFFFFLMNLNEQVMGFIRLLLRVIPRDWKDVMFGYSISATDATGSG